MPRTCSASALVRGMASPNPARAPPDCAGATACGRSCGEGRTEGRTTRLPALEILPSRGGPPNETEAKSRVAAPANGVRSRRSSHARPAIASIARTVKAITAVVEGLAMALSRLTVIGLALSPVASSGRPFGAAASLTALGTCAANFAAPSGPGAGSLVGAGSLGRATAGGGSGEGSLRLMIVGFAGVPGLVTGVETSAAGGGGGETSACRTGLVFAGTSLGAASRGVVSDRGRGVGSPRTAGGGAGAAATRGMSGGIAPGLGPAAATNTPLVPNIGANPKGNSTTGAGIAALRSAQ